MEEIKIWALDGAEAAELSTASQMESEFRLEETLVNNPKLMMEDLTLVGRQTPTDGGPLDLLGIDGSGRLVVFELKRGALYRDAVTQIIDYASSLDSMSDEALFRHISDHSGEHGIDKIDDFEQWYNDNSGAESLDSLRPLRLFLVGLGADDRTECMVGFLARNTGLDISLLTFQGFTHEGKTLLAKQVRVEGLGGGETPQKTKPTKEERLGRLVRRTEELGVHSLFSEIRDMFANHWIGVIENTFGMRLGLRLRNRPESGNRFVHSYARLDPEEGEVVIVFYSRAVELAEADFKHAIDMERIPFRTWPRERKNNALDAPLAEIQFVLSEKEWETHKKGLNSLTSAVYEAYAKGERQG